MNILAIAAGYGLFRPKSGGRNRFYNLIAELIRRENTVIVLQLSECRDSLDATLTKTHYFRVHFGNISLGALTDFNIAFIRKFVNILKSNKIDIIQVSSPFGILSSKILIKVVSQKYIYIIYDAHNVESDIVDCYLKDSKYQLFKKLFILIYIPLIERIAVKCADHIISASQEDKMRFIEKYGINETKVKVISSGVSMIDLTALKDKYETRNKLGISKNRLVIVFHGLYSHPPNREAICLIKNYIAPEVMKVDNNALFVIAGSGVPVFEKDNLKSIGFAEDIYSLLHAADLAIVPVLNGSGTRLKILDYMGTGLPIVSTKKGIEGITAKNGEEAIIVDNVNEGFINAIKHLINNEEERRKIGANARKLAEEEYDWDKIGEKLDKLYRKILEDKRHANN